LDFSLSLRSRRSASSSASASTDGGGIAAAIASGDLKADEGGGVGSVEALGRSRRAARPVVAGVDDIEAYEGGGGGGGRIEALGSGRVARLAARVAMP
jgi:hypothetical protein